MKAVINLLCEMAAAAEAEKEGRTGEEGLHNTSLCQGFTELVHPNALVRQMYIAGEAAKIR